jgi:lysophosphatidylcholine acyltransferase / lyso-PAF acetyltransferase
MGFFGSLSTLGLTPKTLGQGPLPMWRRALRAPMFWLMRFKLFLFGFHWLEIHGEPAPREEAPVLIANHTSMFDPLLMILQHGGTPVSRIENSRTPVIGSIITALQTIYVDRTGSKESRAGVKELIQERAVNDEMPRILIFPEATCTNGQAVISFKPGAFIPGRAVQPVLVTYPDAQSNWDPSWVDGGPQALAIWVGAMMQFHNRMRVEYLPPISPDLPKGYKVPASGLPLDMAIAFARKAQLAMAEAMGVPATQHSFMDVILTSEAVKKRYNPTKAVPELLAFKEVLDLDVHHAKDLLRKFIEADKDKDGSLTVSWRSES